MEDREAYYIGVDVGTGSVRAMLVSQSGHIVTIATHPLDMWEPATDFYEQSSDDIWSACCKTVRMVTDDIDKDHICGIGFDATCSLVVLDKQYEPLSVSPSGKQCQPLSVSPSDSGSDHWNVMVWMDHRAVSQTDRINATGHRVLKCLGGHMSLEMQMPKLLWLKE
ncbi:FGGY carbohydrate kinase domain-containing protein, partial [Lamellibrachia satsuma]